MQCGQAGSPLNSVVQPESFNETPGNTNVLSTQTRSIQRAARRRCARQGFTLVELIVVIAIIGVLSTMVIVRFAGKTDQAKVAAAKTQLSQLEGAVIEFQAHCNRLPQTLDELSAKPADCPGWQDGGYLKSKNLKDPWSRDFVYRVNGGDFEIVCLGADGREGGAGVDSDLSNKGATDTNK
jgi:general secretion pathway protein G